MILSVSGSRCWTDYALIKRILDFYREHHEVELVVHGGAEGADSLCQRYADENGIPCQVVRPDYATHGRRAPLVRNGDIVESGEALIAFWDGESRGTMDAMHKALNLRRTVYLVRVDGSVEKMDGR